MMCFKDKSYCSVSDRCGFKDCDRNFNDEEQRRAKLWWGAQGMKGEPPVAFSSQTWCAEANVIQKELENEVSNLATDTG